jgi:hypothetical protein
MLKNNYPVQNAVMKQLIPLLLISFILFGCKKSSGEDEYYTIKGLVLDYDIKQPVVGAKVYLFEFCCRPKGYIDSAVSDVNGMVSFICKNEGDYKMLISAKDNYLHPLKYMQYEVLAHISRTDTIYLARPSFLQLTVHQSNTYQPSDSILLSVEGDYHSPSSGHNMYRILLKDKVNSTDKVFNLYTFYELPGYDRLTFHYLVTRNGMLLTSQYVQANLTQFGTQNFTLNY